MTQILNKVREVDPNDSDAVKDVVNSFFQKVTKIENSCPIKWLRTLGDVLNRFPKYCVSHRGTIENLLITYIDSNNFYNVIEAAKCVQAVQQVRPSQERVATPKTSWQDLMSLLCIAAHALVTEVFPKAMDMYIGSRNEKIKEQPSTSPLVSALLNITSLASDQSKGAKKSLLQTRLKNVFCFIQAMLVEVYPVAKPVRPQMVLDVIARALSASNSSNNSGVDVLLVKIEALRTLDALVACLGSNLIPFSPLVIRLLMQTLRWTSENTNQDSSKVRCAAYSSVGNWLQTLGCHRSAADSRTVWEDELTDHILKDTAPAEKIVQLTMGPQPTKNMSKKAKRKLANARLLESSIASHMPGEKNKISMPEEINDQVSMAALECAEVFLLVCGRFLKPTTHKLIQERAIRECYNWRRYREEALVLLLRVAEASRKTAPAALPPPSQHCLQLYSALGNAAHGEISKFCTQALLDIRLHLHCSPPSLRFALDSPVEKQPSAKKRKKVSDKNRAALESLLGPDRMPNSNEDEEDDVITVPDEPSSKKQRLAEDEDKISVSSDSMSSVEICDDSEVEEITANENDVELNGVVDKNSNDSENAEVNKSNENNAVDLSDDNTDGRIEVFISEDKIVVVMESTEPEMEEDIEMNTEISEQSQHMQDKEKSDDNVVEQGKFSINEAPTQLPLNVSTDTIDGEEGPLSLEVAYDYPNTANTTINVLNKVDDEVLPSTNETDDVTITCGQVVKSSQEVYLEKKSDDTDVSEVEMNEIVKMNGNASEKENTDNREDIPTDNISDGGTAETKIVSKDGAASIEDMLADFVDEVNEDVPGT